MTFLKRIINSKLIVFSNVRMLRCNSLRKSSSLENNDKVKENEVKQLLDDAAALEEESDNSWHTSPYPKGVHPRNQALYSFRPKVDPSETSIIVFPGQGVQYVGMGSQLLKFPSVRDIFEAASSILKYDILKLCLNGPIDKLNRTDYQQCAIFVCSLAALEALKEEQPSIIEKCIATAGFSLGEISALVFAEVLSFEDALKLIQVRGKAMQLASEMSKGAMLTVFYGPDSKLGAACLKATEHAKSLGVENAYCGVSNYLFPHCKMVAGHVEAIEFIENNRSEFKLKKMRRLPVSGAFHSPLMQPAVEVFRAALKKVTLQEPVIAVHSNIDGKCYKSCQHIYKLLPKQIVAPVKWEQTLHVLYERPQDVPFPRTYECGPGKSLTTILKMVNGKAWEQCYNVPV